MKLSISRYNPERDKTPCLQDYEIELSRALVESKVIRAKRRQPLLNQVA